MVLIYDHNITLFFLKGWSWRGLVQPTDGLLPINTFFKFSDPTPMLILQSCPGADVEVLLLDLKSLESIRNCASEFKSRNQALHLLVRPLKSNLILIRCLVLKLSLYLNLSRQFNIPLNPMCICIDILFYSLLTSKTIYFTAKKHKPSGAWNREWGNSLGHSWWNQSS